MESSFLPTQVDAIVSLLLKEKVGVMPTDTIYGLHCLAKSEASKAKIYNLKKRPSSMPYITLIPSPQDLAQFGVDINNFSQNVINEYWPGPNTLIFETQKKEFLSFRVPNNAFLNKVLQYTGPLISTSANVHGMPAAQDIVQAKRYFGSDVDFYVDNGILNNAPSSVYKLENETIIKLR